MRLIQRKSDQVHTTINKSKAAEEDERVYIFKNEPEKGKNLVQSLIRIVYVVYYSSVGPAVKHKCLCSALKMLYHSPNELLRDVLLNIPISSYIAGMLSSSDLRIVSSALQKIDILMTKLSDIFHVHFRREGVMHKVKLLADADINKDWKCLTSPNDKKEGDKILRKNQSSAELSSTFHGVSMPSESTDLVTKQSK